MELANEALAIAGAYGGADYLGQPLGSWFTDRLVLAQTMVMAGHICFAVIPGVPGLLIGLALITIGTGALTPNAYAMVAGRATERNYLALELERRLTHATVASNATRTGHANATHIAPKPSPTNQSEPENPPPSVAKVTAAIPRMVSMLIAKSDRSIIKMGLEIVTLAGSFHRRCVNRL